jgi:hypothetical protein
MLIRNMAIISKEEIYLRSQESDDEEEICDPEYQKKQPVKATNFSELPSELLFLIASFLEGTSLGELFENCMNIRRVNKLTNDSVLEYFKYHPCMKLFYITPRSYNFGRKRDLIKNPEHETVRNIIDKNSYLKKEMFSSLIINAFDDNILQSLRGDCKKEQWKKYSDVNDKEVPENAFLNVTELSVTFSTKFVFRKDKVSGKRDKRFYTKENVTLLMKHFPNVRELRINGYFNPELFEYAPELHKLKNVNVTT